MPHWRYSILHPTRLPIRQYLAQDNGVTLEHWEETIRRRKLYKRARWYRLHERKKYLRMNPLSKVQHKKEHLIREGEGELHGYLRMLGLSLHDFSRLTGISYSSLRAWSGWPLYAWPCEFLRMYGWAINMSNKLRELGIDAEKLKPPIPDKRLKKNTHPRSKNPLILVMPGEWSPWTHK